MDEITVVETYKGEKIPFKDFLGKGKIIGFYYSASWCGPCVRNCFDRYANKIN